MRKLFNAVKREVLACFAGGMFSLAIILITNLYCHLTPVPPRDAGGHFQCPDQPRPDYCLNQQHTHYWLSANQGNPRAGDPGERDGGHVGVPSRH